MNLFELLQNEQELTTVLIYPGYYRETDPYEHTKEEVLLSPISIKTIVTEIGFGGLKYKYFGEMPIGSKQILCEKKYLTLLKIARKITIDNENYGIYVDADKRFQIIIKKDYLVVLLEKRHE